MNILLDTHTLIWFLQGNDQLGDRNRLMLEDPENFKFLSIASIWEMALKINSGKLTIIRPLPYFVPKEIELIHIKLDHIYQLEKLPFHHKDPFDRLIISTGLVENLTIMSVDENFDKYNVNLIWNDKTSRLSNETIE